MVRTVGKFIEKTIYTERFGINMNLREIREYYGKVTGLLSFMNLVFVTVIAGLGIYVADIVSKSTSEDEVQLFCLYTVFILGVPLIFMLLAACFIGRNDKYEGAFKFRKFLSVVVAALGILSFGVSANTTITTYKEWDAYTTVIYLILLICSGLTVLSGILMFFSAYKGSRYYDSKKNAKDIPESFTLDNCNKKYQLLISLSYVIFSISVFLLSWYFANEIDSFSVQDLSDNSSYSNIYNIMFVSGVITTVIVLITGISAYFLKDKKFVLTNRIAYGLNTVVQAAFVVYSLMVINKKFVSAQSPDITYIVFAIVLAVFSMILLLKALPSKKTNQK